MIEDIKKDIESRQEESGSLPTVQFDEAPLEKSAVVYEGTTTN